MKQGPLLWVDKACIDQTAIEENLASLPIFPGCKQLLVRALRIEPKLFTWPWKASYPPPSSCTGSGRRRTPPGCGAFARPATLRPRLRAAYPRRFPPLGAKA